MKYALHRFESFTPRKLDARKESPIGQKIEQKKKARKAEIERIKTQYEFELGKPVLALELANKIDGRVVRDGDLSWKIECDEFSPYAIFAIWFSIDPEESVSGFNIVNLEGDYAYQGEDIEKAYDTMNAEIERDNSHI